jgi:hypothetical protein
LQREKVNGHGNFRNRGEAVLAVLAGFVDLMLLIVTQTFLASSTGASLILRRRKPVPALVSVSLSELEELSLLIEFDWLSLATFEEAGLPVEEGDWQDIVQVRKARQTKPTNKHVFLIDTLLSLLVAVTILF